MDQSPLGVAGVRGLIRARINEPVIAPWVPLIANRYLSDAALETYAGLGAVPLMREWVGGRQINGLRTSQMTVINTHYEASLGIREEDMRRDHTGFIRAQASEFMDAADNHWEILLRDLILNASTTVNQLDGQYFFDTDHLDGASGTQSNSISVDISTLPATLHGSTTAPSIEEMQQAITSGAIQISTFKDDQGRPMNRGASQFLVIVPPSLQIVANNAVAPSALAALAQNLNPAIGGMSFTVMGDVDFASWTDKFAIFRTDQAIKPFMLQQETAARLQVLDENSDHFKLEGEYVYMLDAWRSSAYQRWQGACLVTLT